MKNKSLIYSILGSFILEGIGAFMRWVCLRAKGGKVSYKQVFKGSETELQKSIGYGFVNILIGAVFILLLIKIIQCFD